MTCFFWLAIFFSGFFCLSLLLLLVVHFLMPKNIVSTYFRPPHFNKFECKLFSGIPYSPIRTVIFITVIAFPKKGKRRDLTIVHQMVPQWFRLVSTITILSLLFGASTVIFLFCGFYFWDLIAS